MDWILIASFNEAQRTFRHTELQYKGSLKIDCQILRLLTAVSPV